MRLVVLSAAMLALAGWGVGCSQPAPPEPARAAEWFADATDALGVAFAHDCGDPSDYLMPRVMGSGCAAFDADGDGRLDLLFLQNAGPGSGKANELYLQRPDGTFKNASAGSGLDFDGFNMGVAIGDVDDDGLVDVVITQCRGIKLLKNLGGGKFRDVTAEAGLSTPYWGTSASFFDYDRDGRLDLVVANYVQHDPASRCSSADGTREFCGPTQYPGAGRPAQLWQNVSANGKVQFRDVSRESGLEALSAPGLGVVCLDLTGDGWADVFVANDTGPNRLWVNQKDGTFVDEGVARGVAFTGMGQTAANMGIAVGDVDSDGLADLFVTHLTTEMNTLWKQGPPGLFTDRTLAAGAVKTAWRGTGFGTLMADFDRDGRVDLALVNGRISKGDRPTPELAPFWQRYGERNQLLHNRGGTFADVSEANPALCGRANVARGLAVGDLDRDGRPDLVLTTVADRARVLLNRAAPEARYLAVRPLTKSGAPATNVVVELTAGGRRQVRHVQPGMSYLCASEPEALFGLGGLTAVESLTLRWPDGTVQDVPPPAVDQRLTVRQP